MSGFRASPPEFRTLQSLRRPYSPCPGGYWIQLLLNIELLDLSIDGNKFFLIFSISRLSRFPILLYYTFQFFDFIYDHIEPIERAILVDLGGAPHIS